MNAKGIFFFFILTVAAFSSLLLLTINIVLLPIHSLSVIKWRRWWASVLSEVYFDFAGYVILSLGTKIFIYSEDSDILNNKNIALVICNHRTRVDWMFAGWMLSAINNSNRDLR